MTILFIRKLEEVGWWDGQVEILARRPLIIATTR
jgi:hypothetical protein